MTTETLTVYIDESGNLGQDQGRYFTLAAVVGTTEAMKGLRRRQKNAAERFRRSSPTKKWPNNEVKAAALNQKERATMLRQVLTPEIQIYALILDKRHLPVTDFASKNSSYDYWVQLLLDQIVATQPRITELLTQLDQRALKDGSQNSLADHLRIHFNFEMQRPDLTVTISYYESQLNYGIQAADFAANAINNFYETQKKGAYTALHKNLRQTVTLPQAVFGENGSQSAKPRRKRHRAARKNTAKITALVPDANGQADQKAGRKSVGAPTSATPTGKRARSQATSRRKVTGAKKAKATAMSTTQTQPTGKKRTDSAALVPEAQPQPSKLAHSAATTKSATADSAPTLAAQPNPTARKRRHKRGGRNHPKRQPSAEQLQPQAPVATPLRQVASQAQTAPVAPPLPTSKQRQRKHRQRQKRHTSTPPTSTILTKKQANGKQTNNEQVIEEQTNKKQTNEKMRKQAVKADQVKTGQPHAAANESNSQLRVKTTAKTGRKIGAKAGSAQAKTKSGQAAQKQVKSGSATQTPKQTEPTGSKQGQGQPHKRAAQQGGARSGGQPAAKRGQSAATSLQDQLPSQSQVRSTAAGSQSNRRNQPKSQSRKPATTAAKSAVTKQIQPHRWTIRPITPAVSTQEQLIHIKMTAQQTATSGPARPTQAVPPKQQPSVKQARKRQRSAAPVSTAKSTDASITNAKQHQASKATAPGAKSTPARQTTNNRPSKAKATGKAVVNQASAQPAAKVRSAVKGQAAIKAQPHKQAPAKSGQPTGQQPVQQGTKTHAPRPVGSRVNAPKQSSPANQQRAKSASKPATKKVGQPASHQDATPAGQNPAKRPARQAGQSSSPVTARKSGAKSQAAKAKGSATSTQTVKAKNQGQQKARPETVAVPQPKKTQRSAKNAQRTQPAKPRHAQNQPIKAQNGTQSTPQQSSSTTQSRPVAQPQKQPQHTSGKSGQQPDQTAQRQSQSEQRRAQRSASNQSKSNQSKSNQSKPSKQPAHRQQVKKPGQPVKPTPAGDSETTARRHPWTIRQID
ncbi:DUF3800 domain-containing protein [Lapidilactobacillus achengensis]|uniref:DUF3800 domain-containing protein n=1 Tax=Lapidilactobacillus achengensis TaxID=2486000 RepID=A0ABW1UN33_9LACO|nr:DUF3800 domain-containing protein [Lapidilactobacillus achengensis]